MISPIQNVWGDNLINQRRLLTETSRMLCELNMAQFTLISPRYNTISCPISFELEWFWSQAGSSIRQLYNCTATVRHCPWCED